MNWRRFFLRDRSEAEQRAELEAYLDGNMAFMTALRIDTLPTTILYNAEGEEVWRMTGMEDWGGSRAAGLIKEAS